LPISNNALEDPRPARTAVAFQKHSDGGGFNFSLGATDRIIDAYLKRSGVDIRAEHEIDNLGMAMSLVASTRGVTLLPAYAQNFLPWSVISRPLRGEAPTIDLVIGYNRATTSPILKLFLSKSDDLISRVSGKADVQPANGHGLRR
jgi:DNA-binding transcriptional LysR family regulator